MIFKSLCVHLFTPTCGGIVFLHLKIIQKTHNRLVAGLNPAGPTILKNPFAKGFLILIQLFPAEKVHRCYYHDSVSEALTRDIGLNYMQPGTLSQAFGSAQQIARYEGGQDGKQDKEASFLQEGKPVVQRYCQFLACPRSETQPSGKECLVSKRSPF
jgi:hypothetical protein